MNKLFYILHVAKTVCLLVKGVSKAQKNISSHMCKNARHSRIFLGVLVGSAFLGFTTIDCKPGTKKQAIFAPENQSTLKTDR